MTFIWATFFALLGAVVASFLNVCIDRVPRNMSLISPASHCPSCQHRLAVKDLIPIFSYLYLRGRCRYCGAAIGQRLLWMEIGTATFFVLLYLFYGLTLELALAIFYGSLFIVLTVIDFEQYIIPNRIVYPAAVVSLLVAILRPDGTASESLIGGSAGLGIFLVVAIISRGGMGWGDVKMAALVGLITGFPLVFIAIFLSIIGGGLLALLLLLTGVKKRKEAIPFGPFLSLAAMVTLLWGSNILNWYLGLFHPI